jgi:hypothetical protein
VQPVERSNPDGVDFGWVMQTTFVVTILVGSPIVAFLSTTTPLPTWGARASFAVRVGAVVWLLTAVAVYLYARRVDAGDGGSRSESDPTLGSDLNPDTGSDPDPSSASERGRGAGGSTGPDTED